MTLSAPLGPGGVLFWDDFGIRTTKLKVDLPSTTYVNIRLFTMPAQAGDTLVITGEVNLTTNVGRSLTPPYPVTGEEYPVGVGTSVWVYNASGPPELRPASYVRLGTNGENVTPETHHIQQGLTRPYVVPPTWDPTHQIAVLLRVDVHSSGWDDNQPAGSDYVFVEQHGTLQCQRWRQPPPPVEDPRWADIEARLAALESATAPEVECGPVA